MKIKKIQKDHVTFTAPPSKAHTLRALILSSMARGTSTITNPLLGKDQLHLISCLKNLGIHMEHRGSSIIVKGSGGDFQPVETTLDCGESGVSMNVLTALSCIVEGEIILTGADGLLKRPVGEIVDGMRQLGAEINYLNEEGYPPLAVKSTDLPGGKTSVSGAKNSQYFSAVTMVAPYARNLTLLTCEDYLTEKPYYDITLEMMSRFGIAVENLDYEEVHIPRGSYRSTDINIEGDYSSASFFMTAAAVTGTEIAIKGLTENSVQGDRKIIDYLKMMGCSCSWNGEILTLKGAELNAVSIDMSDTPDLVPPMTAAAAFAEGTSHFSGVGHLRYKECDRIEAIITNLKRMGIESYFRDDCLTIKGNPDGAIGAEIDSYNDHRIAMSFAVAGLVTGDQSIQDTACVKKSFPDFWERFKIFSA